MSGEKILESSGEGVTLDQLRGRIKSYGDDLREILVDHDASIDTYKFSVEKDGDAYAIEVAVRASIQPKKAAHK